MYMKQIDVCCVCGEEIPDRSKARFLDLMDRENLESYQAGESMVMAPKLLYEYCLCDKCFREFNQKTRFPARLDG